MGTTQTPLTKDGRIKVMQIVGNARLGGVVSCVLNYYSHMDRSRYRFDFVTYGPSPLDEKLRSIDPDSRVFTVPPFDGTSCLGAMRALKKILREGGYAIVHSHLTTLSAFALRAAKSAGVPVRICHAHSTFDRQSDHYAVKAILRPFAARYATHRMACGSLAAQNLYRNHADDALILHNAIDLETFSFDKEARAKLGLFGRVLLFAGRFAPQKNLFFLLEAFALARKKYPEIPFTLAMVGDGAQKQELISKADALGLAESVRWVDPCRLTPWYSAADLFCLPSLYEGFPVVGIEAQACGLPCLFSDKITREADICKKNVFLPLDAEVWADAMAKDLPRIADAQKILRTAGYDIRLEADNLAAFYDRALGARLSSYTRG